MKIRSFILGGIAGAITVLLIQRNPKVIKMAADLTYQAKNRVDNFLNETLDKGLAFGWAVLDTWAANKTDKPNKKKTISKKNE